MNYIKHLTGFFYKINDVSAINPTHISLYLALFQCWNVNRFKNPTGISREEIMAASKIRSKATYHKCMKELQTLGFIEYLPTFNPHSSSNVIMANFSDEVKNRMKIEIPTGSNIEPLQDLTLPRNEQVIEQVNEQVYIYNKKQTYKNNLNIESGAPSQNEPVQNLILEINPKEKRKEKSYAKKEKDEEDLAYRSEDLNLTIPTLEMAMEYFIFQNNTILEANKFFNYYSSTGWLVGGKTKMKDWKAAARNWIMNENKFKINSPAQQLHPQNLSTTTSKNYAEPL